jgi:hypothetical protein
MVTDTLDFDDCVRFFLVQFCHVLQLHVSSSFVMKTSISSTQHSWRKRIWRLFQTKMFFLVMLSLVGDSNQWKTRNTLACYDQYVSTLVDISHFNAAVFLCDGRNEYRITRNTRVFFRFSMFSPYQTVL